MKLHLKRRSAIWNNSIEVKVEGPNATFFPNKTRKFIFMYLSREKKKVIDMKTFYRKDMNHS